MFLSKYYLGFGLNLFFAQIHTHTHTHTRSARKIEIQKTIFEFTELTVSGGKVGVGGR